MSNLPEEMSNRLCQRGEWYPIWYKDYRFVFKLDQYSDALKYRIKVMVAKETEYTGLFGQKKIRREVLREMKSLRMSQSTIQMSSEGFVSEYRFGYLWPELKETLDEVLISDIKPEQPFVINCSQEFNV